MVVVDVVVVVAVVVDVAAVEVVDVAAVYAVVYSDVLQIKNTFKLKKVGIKRVRNSSIDFCGKGVSSWRVLLP